MNYIIHKRPSSAAQEILCILYTAEALLLHHSIQYMIRHLCMHGSVPWH